MSRLDDLRREAEKADRREVEAKWEYEAAQAKRARLHKQVADEEKGWHIVPGSWNLLRKGDVTFKVEFIEIGNCVVPFVDEQKRIIADEILLALRTAP